MTGLPPIRKDVSSLRLVPVRPSLFEQFVALRALGGNVPDVMREHATAVVQRLTFTDRERTLLELRVLKRPPASKATTHEALDLEGTRNDLNRDEMMLRRRLDEASRALEHGSLLRYELFCAGPDPQAELRFSELLEDLAARGTPLTKQVLKERLDTPSPRPGKEIVDELRASRGHFPAAGVTRIEHMVIFWFQHHLEGRGSPLPVQVTNALFGYAQPGGVERLGPQEEYARWSRPPATLRSILGQGVEAGADLSRLSLEGKAELALSLERQQLLSERDRLLLEHILFPSARRLQAITQEPIFTTPKGTQVSETRLAHLGVLLRIKLRRYLSALQSSEIYPFEPGPTRDKSQELPMKARAALFALRKELSVPGLRSRSGALAILSHEATALVARAVEEAGEGTGVSVGLLAELESLRLLARFGRAIEDFAEGGSTPPTQALLGEALNRLLPFPDRVSEALTLAYEKLDASQCAELAKLAEETPEARAALRGRETFVAQLTSRDAP